jgi:hypothetical protein
MTAWLRCVDHTSGDHYPLNPAHIIYVSRHDGWWRAVDVRGIGHDIAHDDDDRVEALTARVVVMKPAEEQT